MVYRRKISSLPNIAVTKVTEDGFTEILGEKVPTKKDDYIVTDDGETKIVSAKEFSLKYEEVI